MDIKNYDDAPPPYAGTQYPTHKPTTHRQSALLSKVGTLWPWVQIKPFLQGIRFIFFAFLAHVISTDPTVMSAEVPIQATASAEVPIVTGNCPRCHVCM